MVRLRTLTLIIQTVIHCNLQCRYCYLGKSKRAAQVSLSLVERVLSQVCRYNGKQETTGVVWHGGEPLLAGLEFYREIRQLQSTVVREFKIENLLQTNGVLLDEEWARFFLDANFHIGISLDGPKEVHDACRVFPGGEGSFDLILENIIRAKRLGLHPGIICVLTKLSLGKEREIYSLFKKLGLSFDFGAVATTGPLALTPEELAKSSLRFFDLWFNDPTPAGHHAHAW